MWKRIAEGTSAASLTGLKDYEDEIAEGQRGRLFINLRTPAPSSIVLALQEKLQDAGVLDAEVFSSGNDLEIRYRKGFPWLVVIVAIVLGLIVLAVLIVAWQFYGEVEETIPKEVLIAGAVVGVVLLALIAFIIYKRAGPRLSIGGIR